MGFRFGVLLGVAWFAEPVFKKALYLQPINADLLANIGISHLALGQREQAASMWAQALSCNVTSSISRRGQEIGRGKK